MAARRIEAEFLDVLPEDDARAIRSRADLARINAIMLQPAIMARAMQGIAPAARIVDLGAGDGTFMLRVLRRLRPAGADITLVDRAGIVGAATTAKFRALEYELHQVRADVFSYLESAPPSDVICANLFLHHFEDAQLRRLLALAAGKCTLFVACEPRRGGFPLLASRFLWALGANQVTRHDAVVSVRAGFAGQELSALWPDHPRWRLEERSAALFSHLFVARRGAS